MMFIPMKMIRTLLLVCLCFSNVVWAQGRPVRLIIGTPAGSSADYFARLIAERMARSLGTPVVVENKPGASGTIAAEFAAKSAPDGNTLLFGSSSEVVAVPFIRPSSIRYRVPDDFSFVGLGVVSPGAIVVGGDSKLNSISDFVAAAKTRDVKIAYAGAGGAGQFALEVAQAKIGMSTILGVPYPALTNAVADIVAGRIDGYFGNYAPMRPLIESGKLRLIALSAESRIRSFPEVKTFREQGVDFVATGLSGILAPAGTPPSVLTKLSSSFSAALKDPVVKDAVELAGGEVRDLPLEQFRTYVMGEIQWYQGSAKKYPQIMPRVQQ